MTNSKLPHERLREWADRAEDGYDCPSTCMTTCMLESGEVSHESRFDAEEVAAFRRLADEIERYYIARPRYEDGEPVQFGDEVRLKGVTVESREIAVNREGDWFVRDRPYGGICGRDSTRLERSAPKVLDADGVPIEVGDTVWHVDSGEELTVEEFANRGLGLVKCSDEDLACEDFDACMLTHREPDSLRKLRDDMRTTCALVVRADCMVIHEWTDRLTALMERGAE